MISSVMVMFVGKVRINHGDLEKCPPPTHGVNPGCTFAAQDHGDLREHLGGWSQVFMAGFPNMMIVVDKDLLYHLVYDVSSL